MRMKRENKKMKELETKMEKNLFEVDVPTSETSDDEGD